MLKLKLQNFGNLMWRVDSLEKTLMLGGIGGRRRRDDRGWDGWMASLTRWMWIWVNSGRWWWTGRPGMLRFLGSQRVGHDWVTELNWTEFYWKGNSGFFLQTPVAINYLVHNPRLYNSETSSLLSLKMFKLYFLRFNNRKLWWFIKKIIWLL